MKRMTAMILLTALFLSGCTSSGERVKEPVTFYYLREEYQYFTEDGVISTEIREASGHREELSYLMALYFMGPAEEELVSPLPSSATLLHVSIKEDGIRLLFSDTKDYLTDYEFSLACACLAMTCFDLTEEDTINIQSGERTTTMHRDQLSQFDGSAPAMEETP